MSKIYDALKKLEAERGGGAAAGGNGGNGKNGKNGRNGRSGRRAWQWLFGNGRTKAEARPVLRLPLGADAEEQYQRLGTNLLAGPGAESAAAPRLLGVVGSRHGEGATTTAAVFASILVRRRGGPVAVVEANFRSPGFETVFNIPRNGGFAELILGQRPLAELALPTEIPNLFAVMCGHSALGPSALFDSPGLPAALDQLRKQFEFVIFDLPPVTVYSDASILAPRLDAALIVIEADRTRISEVERTRRSLERVGVKLAGSVLNRRRSYIPAFLEEML